MIMECSVHQVLFQLKNRQENLSGPFGQGNRTRILRAGVGAKC